MRSRRNATDEALYWPAFADIMTVTVVVLICTFAAAKKPDTRLIPPNGESSGKVETVGGSDLPVKTRDEFKAAVLRNRMECLLKGRPDLEAVKSNSLV